MEVSGQFHLAAWSPGRNHGTHCVGGFVCPRASLDILEKMETIFLLLGFEPQMFHPTA